VPAAPIVPLKPKTGLEWATRRFRFALERNQWLVWAFDFLFGLEEFFTPRFTCALGARANRAPNSETVIAGPLRAGGRELLAGLAGLEELAFERPVLVPQFVFTDDAHALLLDYPALASWVGSFGPCGSCYLVENEVLRLRFSTIIASCETLLQ
jgi:hypothetical protein